MGVKMNSLMPKKSEILQRFEIDKKNVVFFDERNGTGYIQLHC